MFIKKVVGVTVYISIITLFVFGCMNIKSSVGNKNIEKYFHENVDERYRIGVENYVFLIKNHQMELGCDDLTSDPMCMPLTTSTATGLVFSSDKNSLFVLTAAHFCKSYPILGTSEIIYGVAKDQERPLYILAMDEETDICLLMGTKYNNEAFNQIKLELNVPSIGSDVYTVASPNGVAGEGLRPIFTGKFAGCNDINCMTTIPATFGSSGAGIYTSEGKLITIVMAVTTGFENLVLSPSQEDLHKFILTIDSVIDIYQY
tara:strand:+ start:876 stop:1655 length:780 start_codon:yes stop_codon:yes gene_type:complete